MVLCVCAACGMSGVWEHAGRRVHMNEVVLSGGLCNVVGSFWRPVECCGDGVSASLGIHVDAEDIVSKCVGATIEAVRMRLCGTLMWVHGFVLCVVVAAFVYVSREFLCVL